MLIKSTLLILTLVSLFWGSNYWLATNDAFKIENIVLMNPLQEQNEKQIIDIAQKSIRGNFFNVNLQALRESIEVLAWVESVSVRKVWSNSIQLKIQEKKVKARWHALPKNGKNISSQQLNKQIVWNKKSLVSDKGVVFNPKLDKKQRQKFNHLSIYSGPQKLSKILVNKCSLIEKMLLKINKKLLSCVLNKRRSWAIKLSDNNSLKSFLNFSILLGKSEVNELLVNAQEHKILDKIKLFIHLYKNNLYQYAKDIERIDMRYTNGFAVKWN